MTSFLVLLFFVPILVAVLLIVNVLFSKSQPDAEKQSTYESGPQAVLGQTRAQFNIAYYLPALLFLVFDIDVLLFHPLAVSLNSVGGPGFGITLIFFGLLALGFVAEVGTRSS